jgi:hypothetical protein
VTSQNEPDDGRDREELDRAVSRRVDRPTEATEDDERAYRAADPLPDGGVGDTYRGASGGVSEHYTEPDADSEPTRTE